MTDAGKVVSIIVNAVGAKDVVVERDGRAVYDPRVLVVDMGRSKVRVTVEAIPGTSVCECEECSP
jgi:hypothetical protein